MITGYSQAFFLPETAKAASSARVAETTCSTQNEGERTREWAKNENSLQLKPNLFLRQCFDTPSLGHSIFVYYEFTLLLLRKIPYELPLVKNTEWTRLFSQ